jgi:hypothetical protein
VIAQAKYTIIITTGYQHKEDFKNINKLGGIKMEEKMSSSKVKSNRVEDQHYNYNMNPGMPPGGEPPSEIHHHYYYQPPRPRPSRSSKPGIAGALLILTAIIGIIGAGFIIGSGFFVGDFSDGMNFPGTDDTGDVTGTVRFTNGTPVEGVTISIVGEDLTTETDDSGNYIILEVPSGNHEIKVEKEGYNTIIFKKFVSPGEVKWEAKNGNGHWDHENNEDFVLTEGDRTFERGEYPPWGMIGGMIFVCGVVIMVFSFITLFGGYFALKRKKFSLAIAGAILGIFTIVGAIFSLIALFILIISRNEFKKPEEP